MRTQDIPKPDGRHGGSAWPHRLALLTAGATFLLILAGGVVTSTNSGMAVPDWPTTFGYDMFLFPWSKMVGGILYEHSHRLIGSLVGLCTLALALALWTGDSRRWLRWLGVAAALAVILQGVLGGLRVVLADEQLAIVHGVIAYAFFAFVGSLALFTSRAWKDAALRPAPVDLGPLRRLSLWLTVVLFLQIVAGAFLTHVGRGLGAHLFLAALVSVGLPLLAWRILVHRADWPQLAAPAALLRNLWILQLILGACAYAAMMGALGGSQSPVLTIGFPVAHRLVAALMLATGLTLVLWTYRLGPEGEQALGRQASSRGVPA